MKKGFVALLLLAAVVAGGLFAWRSRAAERPLAAGVRFDAPMAVEDFTLLDTTGTPRPLSSLRGKHVVLFFGYTNCPNVCPATLAELTLMMPMLGAKAKDFQTVFITVDAANDPPAQMKAYVSNPAFPKKIWGLTGTPAQVDAAAKAYKAYYKLPSKPEEQVSHAAYSYLMGPKGGFVCVLPYELTPEQTADKIKAAMAEGANAERC